MQPGQYRVWAQSRDPNDRTSTNPTAWKSKPIVVKAPANDRVELEVCGIGDKTTYSNWKIARAGEQSWASVIDSRSFTVAR